MDITKSFHELLFVIILLCIDTGLGSYADEDYFDEPSFNRCPWIRNKLKNGRVRYRYKGRVAKFLCDSGFELAGKRSSTCVRGQWSNPVPVCVARGCPRVPSISNGRITEMYRGALLVYDCNPGYMLDGNPTIHCDGRRWNSSPPLCAITTENPEMFCDFENPDLCGWSHDPNHEFDWQRNQFATPSGHVGTGPAFDHTFGENKGGFYLYIEASSPRKLNDTARLFSPVYSDDMSGGCFTFWYHMYGATTGGLRVYLKPESHVFDELKPKWEKYGNQGNQWLKGHMIVPTIQENFQIVIEGLRGESYVGDSAIDDVRLTPTICDSNDNSTDIAEAVDQYSCRGRCQESGNESACGCNANCVDEPNFCCRDYYTICTAGNFTTVPNTDEPLPEDYTTLKTVVSQSTASTALEHSAEISTSTTNIQTVMLDSTNSTLVNTPRTTTSSSSSQKPDTTTGTPTTSTTSTKEETTSTELTSTSVMVPSILLITKIYTTPATTMKTTQYISSDTPTSTSTSTTTRAPSTTSVKTTISSTTAQTTISSTTPQTTISLTTPQTTSTTIQTTVPTTKQTTTSTIKSTTPETTSTITSTLSSTLSSTIQTVSIPVFINNSTTSITSLSSFQTVGSSSSSSAATSPNAEPITLSTTTSSSTRKTYNLRPRNRTTTTIYTTAPFYITTKSVLVTSTPLKESTSEPSPTTSPKYLTSWYRHPISTSTKQQSTSSSTESTTKSGLSETSTTRRFTTETTSEANLETTRMSSRFSRPTKIISSENSKSYESKAETTTSNSSVPVVVSILVVILICFIAGFVYYMRKRRGKRQSKLSDDSEMRFLPDSDFMEYSDASALDKILVK